MEDLENVNAEQNAEQNAFDILCDSIDHIKCLFCDMICITI